jgi:phospholipase C
VAGSNNGGLVMSYFDATQLPEGKLAAQYTLCDHYFHEAFGGSFLNHIFFVAMAPPPFPNAPEKLVAQVGPDGMPLKGKDGAVSPDGYGINTLQSVNHPHDPKTSDDELIPSLTMPTIGDRLSDKKVTWAWYAGGYDEALKGKEEGENGAGEGEFAYHHQPFVYFKNYADGTKAKKIHLKDEKDLYAILEGKGKLPSVSFVKFISLDDEHPRDSDVMRGQKHTAELVEKILGSKYGKDCAILITYDEHGGRWDHVAPPKVDKWGPGSRVPFIVISPFAKKGFVDHTTYTTASILKFIENRFKLEPLNDRDGNAANLDNAFDFDQTP